MPYVEYDEVQAACADCGRQFPDTDSLEQHRRTAHVTQEAPRPAQRRLHCSACRKEFYTLGALSDHNRRAHTG